MFFTIVVPTLNRPETLYFTLKTLIDQPGTDYEILVMDDSDNDQNQKVVLEINDAKVRYVKNKQRLGMRGNYEASIDEAKGKYITILGDDDGFVVDALNYAREVINATEPEVLFWWPHMYWWPTALLQHKASILYLHRPKKEYKFVNAFDYVKNIYENQENYFLFERLPSIYNGFVSKEYLRRLKSYVGCYFNDEIPDVYSGIANGVMAKKVIFLDWPLSIRGISGKSYGVAFRSKKGKQIADEFKSAMKHKMCAEELVDSSALAVHVASVKIRAIKTFASELGSYKVNVQAILKGIISEMSESPDRMESLINDFKELSGKYSVRYESNEIFPSGLHAPQRIVGWLANELLAIDTSVLECNDIFTARSLTRSVVGI